MNSPRKLNLDDIFTAPGVVYIASAGDGPGSEWPATSPNVVAASGTTISRNSSTGQFILENTWQDTGGGPSLFEPPALAGVINNAGEFRHSSQAENSVIYQHVFSTRDDFRDITFGNCGVNISNFASSGWDFCTGLGSSLGLDGK